MKYFLLLLLCLSNFVQGKSQGKFTWDEQPQLKIADFRSAASEVNNALTTYSITSGSYIEFNYQMSNIEFLFTKNFNSYVKTVFHPSSSVIIAPDSSTAMALLGFGQYHHDLTELYARKLRKDLYENKTPGSSPSFYQSIYEKNQEALALEANQALKDTELGLNKSKLNLLQSQVSLELQTLSEFCQSCKPKKKRR